MTKQIKETYIHEHKGIEVGVTINYRQKQISLVDTKTLKQKRWLFNARGLEFIKGWKNILEAMAEAMEDARIKLQEYVDDEAAEIEMLCEMEDRPINNERE